MRVLTVGWLAVLLLVFGLVVQTPRAAPATFTAPFTVTSPNGKARLVVTENSNKTGLVMDFFNASGGLVSILGVGETAGSGGAEFRSPNGSQRVTLGLHEDGGPFVELSSEGKKVVEIAEGTTAEMGLRIWSTSGQTIGLENKRRNGYLVLKDAKGTSRVEAGTDQQFDDGMIKVYGPTGKCLPAITGIPCIMLAK